MAGLVSSAYSHGSSTIFRDKSKCSASNVLITSEMDPNSDVPDTREVLGVHLYQKVCECLPNGGDNPTLSQKLTGMLMECNTADLFSMLTDDHLFKIRLEAAQFSLGDNSTLCPSENLDLESNQKLHLGDQLFEKVTEIDSALCAQITGMLLELDQKTIEELLTNDSKLRQAVEKSKEIFLTHHSIGIHKRGIDISKHDETTTTCTESNEELGEMCYNIVESVYPKEAAQITGMLLEIEPTVLHKLLEDREVLMEKINVARKVLPKSL